MQGFGEQWANGWVDSVKLASGPIGDSTGVVQWKLVDGSASTGGVAFGLQPSPAVSYPTESFLVFWVYLDTTFPDTAHIQTWAQDNTWSWPGPKGVADYAGSSIPKNTWYPLYFDLGQASIADTVSSSHFNSFTGTINKLGIQVYNTKTWKGSLYIKSVQFIDSVVAVVNNASWIAADFEKASTGTQGFYVPAAYVTPGVSWARALNTQSTNKTFVLRVGVDFSKEKKIIVQRDTIPLMDAVN